MITRWYTGLHMTKVHLLDPADLLQKKYETETLRNYQRHSETIRDDQRLDYIISILQHFFVFGHRSSTIDHRGLNFLRRMRGAAKRMAKRMACEFGDINVAPSKTYHSPVGILNSQGKPFCKFTS